MSENETNGGSGTSKGIPKAAWFIGGGFLVVLVIGALLFFFGARLFGGGDPIAEIAPHDTMFYMSFDFLKVRSEEVADIFQVFQEMSGVEEMTMIEALDESMLDEFKMSFSGDIIPWIGQYGAFMILDGDVYKGDFDYMFVVEARDIGVADQFIADFVLALDEASGMDFSGEEINGITLYTHEPDYGDAVFIAREGGFLYVANSEEAIFNSIELKKEDSLAKTEGYVNTLAEIPDDRIALMYIGGGFYQSFLDAMAEDLYYSGIDELESLGLGGIGMSVSAEDAGLRFDFAVSYDEEDLSDYQKEVLTVEYLAPTTDALVPEDTFLYLGISRNDVPSFTQLSDSPMCTEDTKEALELFEDEYGISIEELFDMFAGEFAIAIAPAWDGILAEMGEANLGLSIFASTNDEAGFSGWFDDLLDVFAQQMGGEFKRRDANIGDYQLKELVAEEYGESLTLVYYGADNGYFILGTSEGMLEDGLRGKRSLADSETYQNTWQAFPKGSVPYLYLNMIELIDFVKDSGASYSMDEMHYLEDTVEKMPVIAVSMNSPSELARSFTMIFFIIETDNDTNIYVKP
jgi:hypothetical protein